MLTSRLKSSLLGHKGPSHSRWPRELRRAPGAATLTATSMQEPPAPGNVPVGARAPASPSHAPAAPGFRPQRT
ncbi:hypothetical protein SKAU_G00384780 [Synaphobranchus kaupii]|uniref:Uncharacterized protein n=1 Tax=Synaphobranchus kaupii TaxID=118154 RepID=A0A9Q1ID01_SYNKA|nr:hypothetical protein SKAU_G00384780 [Synaphobranchus kaupii]